MPSLEPRVYLHSQIQLRTSGGFLPTDPSRVRFDLGVSLIFDGRQTERRGLLEPESRVSVRGLEALLSPPADAYLFTCGCGDPGCGGYWKPVQSHPEQMQQWPFIRWDGFRFRYRNYQSELLDTPETVYFLQRDVRDLVATTMSAIRQLAERLPGQLSGDYDEDFRAFFTEYFGIPAPPAYAEEAHHNARSPSA